MAAGGENLQDVLRGRTAPRTRTRSNMIRVFVSSAFTDMSSERRALLERAYPEVLAFCRSLGLVFEIVDLRWGIRNFTFGDHEARELFLQEIETSKRISAGPAFTALLGNRYGQRTLPRLIPEKQFEALSSRVSQKPEGIKHLNKWYLRDCNASSPTYVLQPITAHFPHFADLRPESGPKRDKDVLSWRLTETKLFQLLRAVATDAEAAGEITTEQKHLFFVSVTEQELDQGLGKEDDRRAALLFVRESPQQKVRDGPRRFSKLRDLTADGLLDVEAQALLTNLKSRLYAKSKNILNLHCVELCRGSLDPKCKEHTEYLDSICEQFVSQMKARIEAAVDCQIGGKQRKIWGSIEDGNESMSDWIAAEAEHHFAKSAELCVGLHGREGLLGKLCLAMWESTNARHGPLVVHSTAGVGKTALLCKLAQEMRTVLDSRAVVVIRLLSSRHPTRPDIDHLLRSICLQICLACGLAPPTSLSAGTHLALRSFFQNVLEEVSQQGTALLIILDALDQLCDRQLPQRLRWLPTKIPPNVHLVVSMDSNSEVFVNMRMKLETLENFFEVDRLSRDDGKQIIDSYLAGVGRSVTAEQSEAVLQKFEHSGCPRHLMMMLSAAKRWTSSTPLTQLHLCINIQEMTSQLFLTLEEKHGKELVGGALGYIALAREGLLEAELRDILSLDNEVICEVYKHSLPPTPSLIRMPPLLWARLRRDLEDHLEERWAGGIVTIAFKERFVWEAVSARYLKIERRGRSLGILAEYFQGRWSGKLKPVSLPGLTLLLSDRKVPPQPLWFAPGLANVRKMQEMPHHLLHSGMWDELRQEVIGNAEWLYCKSRVCGVSSVLHDLDQCTQYMDCIETRLVRDTLILIKPSLEFLDGHMDMSLFYTELLARLCSLAAPFPDVIGQLCSQCEEWLLTCPEPILIPKSSFLEPPGGALLHTLSGLQGGVLCIDVRRDTGLLVAGSDDGAVAVWSLVDKQLIHTMLGHTAAVLSVKVLADSAHCLSVAADGSLRRWSLRSGNELLCIENVCPIEPSPSSVNLHLCNEVLFVYTRTQVKVLKLDADEPVLSSSSSSEDCLVLGVLEDSVVLLVDSGWVRICRPLSGTKPEESRLEDSLKCVTPLAFVTLPKRQKVFMVSKGSFLYQICLSGKHKACEFPLLPSLLSVSEDEKFLLAAAEESLSLFNMGKDSVDRFLKLQHDDDVLCACISSDARLLVSGAADQLIRVWSVTTGALLDTLCGTDAPLTVLRLYGSVVLSASSAAPCLRLWCVKYDDRHKPTVHIPSAAAHVAVSNDAERVFYVHQQSDMEVISWNNNTGCLAGRMALSSEVGCMEVAQQKRLLLCGLVTGTVLIYPLDLPQETLCIPPPESLARVLCLAVGPQDNQVAVAYEDAVCLFDITTRDNFPTVEGPAARLALPLLQAPPSSMALLRDRRLLYGTSCGEVKLHDFAGGGGGGGGGSSLDLESHRSRVTCVTASNGGAHALVGSEDAVQRLWALDPLALDHTMEYKGFFFEGVLCAAFSDSDQFVFTGSQDRTVKVWDVATGNLLLVQYVYSPVLRMVTYRTGFVALTEQGRVLKEVFRCPDHVSPDYNPLRSVKAQYRVTSREKRANGKQDSEQLDFTPSTQFNLNLMSALKAKPSPTCSLL